MTDAIDKHYWVINPGTEAHRVIGGVKTEQQAIIDIWCAEAKRLQAILNLPDFNNFRFIHASKNPPPMGQASKISNIVFADGGSKQKAIRQALRDMGIKTVEARDGVRIHGRDPFLKRLPDLLSPVPDLPDLRRAIQHALRELSEEAKASDYFGQLMDGVGIREIEDAYVITGKTEAWKPILEPAGAVKVKASEAIRLMEEAAA
jgi:hypothetical protein